MPMWPYHLAVILGGLILGVLIAVGRRPNVFRVERSLLMKASPESIYPYLIDFREGDKWSPWEKMDPNMKKTRSGPDSGVGSVHEWSGNDKVGQGRIEIMAAVPNESVTLKLDFFKPFECHNTVIYSLAREGDGTRMTWSMFGPQGFMGKLFGLFMNMDRMVGRDFEKGLASLKELVEAK